MPPGGDPAFLIFGSFDQAKERTKKNKRDHRRLAGVTAFHEGS